MQCYTELIRPTAVTHAVALPFVSATADNLVAVKTSILQIFELRATSTNGSVRSHLSLLAEYPLAGIVTSLARVRLQESRTGGEALLIAFEDAKLSLVEWDAENHRIFTVSIHYYEGENVVLQPFGPGLAASRSILMVDPESRCAALKFGARHLAMLPFKQAVDDLADGEEADTNQDAPNTMEKSKLNDVEKEATPYKSSFVLPLTALNPELNQPVHLDFLHEYREPTLGILSGSVQASSALIEERKDCLTYTAYTLDLEQRASTNLITVPKLPSDLWKVVPLPLPVGGALLVGTNEFVHVDQGGKTNAIAVNEFAKVSSDFNMVDQSYLNIKLENSEIAALDHNSGDLLVILNDGSLAKLSFKLLGRTIGGLDVSRVADDKGGMLIASSPSCAVSLHGCKTFVGSSDGDAVLLAWAKEASSMSRKRSYAQMLEQTDAVNGEGQNEDSDDPDEDDLYAPTSNSHKPSALPSPSSALKGVNYTFESHDSITSIGPIDSACLGRSSASGQGKLEMLAATGRGRASRLSFLSRDIIAQTMRKRQFENVRDVWSAHARKKRRAEVDEDIAALDNLFFVRDGQSTKPYSLATDVLNPLHDTDFETEGETIFIDTVAGHTRVVQARSTELRIYDSDLGLSQIIPQTNDETDEELHVVHVSVSDDYILVLRGDSTLQIHQVDKGGDIEPLDVEDSAIFEHKWTSGCIYEGILTNGNPTAFLLDEDGALRCYSLPSLKEVYFASNLPFLPPVMSRDMPQRRMGAKEALTEVLACDIGHHGMNQPFLIVRTATDDLALYEPFHYPTPSAGSWHDSLRFRKVPSNYIPRFDEAAPENSAGRPAPLTRVLVGDYMAVHISGHVPSLLLKSPTSLPKVVTLRTPQARSFAPVNTADCEHGFAIVDYDGCIHESCLPPDAEFSTGWSIRKLDLGQEIRHVAFHLERGLYVIATCEDVDFNFVEDDNRHHEQDDIELRPRIPLYTIHLVSPESHKILHSLQMPYTEAVTSLKVMNLEVSENTHDQKSMVVVAAAALRGEDMPAKGIVLVLDILDVVPEPDNPESGVKLHIFSRDETKGAITAVEPFNGGLVGTAQGQKLMVRGLKEDGSCLPVAFLDAQCQMTTLKTFGKSGLWLGGDCWKGLWFGGFVEEPYKISLLGKSRPKMEVVAAEFLPFDGQLYLIVIDASMDLHVLQYDPENPKSVGGTRLLDRSTFHTGRMPTSMMLLPSTLAPFVQQGEMANGEEPSEEDQQQASMLYHVLITTAEGSIALLTPLDEPTYRRLTALQTHLTSVLEHAAGMNPRAYRAVSSEEYGARGVVDGDLVMRVSELGAPRRSEMLGRAGMDAWTLRSDCEIIGGRGLAYI